jgi:hypothetical protein
MILQLFFYYQSLCFFNHFLLFVPTILQTEDTEVSMESVNPIKMDENEIGCKDLVKDDNKIFKVRHCN